MSAPGVYVDCTGCGVSVLLPAANGRVLLAPLDGWTFPPRRCPTCSRSAAVKAAKERT